MSDDQLDVIELTQNQAEKLKQIALEYEKLESNRLKRFLSESNNQYILSKKWLDNWKRYISYDEIINGKAPNKYFGKINLEYINADIIDSKISKCFKYIPLNNHPWNTYMKDGLIEDVDYVIVDKEIWTFFTTYTHSTAPIIRTVNGEGKDKQVVVNLLKFKSVLLYPQIIKSISNDRMYKQTFEQEYLQVDRNMKLKDYYSLIQKTLPTFNGNFNQTNGVRLWRYRTTASDTYKALYNEVEKQVADLENYDPMCFDLDAEYLTPQQFETLEDVAILENDLIIVEFKDDNKPWCIRNKAVQVEGKCDNCQQTKILNHPCVCRKVAYCSQECKQKDHNFHNSRCEKYGSDDETIKALTLQPESIKGVTGLSNLGNTCFMNSGTQCISNTFPLTEYFLKNLYFDEINMDNPIGTKGQLVKRFGSLLKKMWYGEKQVVTPTNYKKAIGQFQPMFKGYHQHDSSELITFLLDGIHEDLNRVKKKPYVETKDSEGRTDYVVAKESWLNHLARNQSIIVDLMHGQYKSTLRCPNCNRHSITFDPYLMVQLGIPSIKKRTITFRLFKGYFTHQQKTIPFDKSKNIPLKEYLQTLQQQLNLNDQTLFPYIQNSYSSNEILQEQKSIVDIRKSAKRAQLCIRVLTEDEIKIENKYPVQFSIKYLESNFKKQYFVNGYFIFDAKDTLKQIHERIFVNFQQFFVGVKITNYESDVLKQYYTILYKSNANFWTPCAFCNSKNCSDCEVKYDDETLEQVRERALKVDSTCNFEIIILWKKCPFVDIKMDDLFNHYNKLYKLEEEEQSNIPTQNHNHSNQLSGSVTLQDCLSYSQQPEQLNVDNTWYCKQCKEHVQAYKSMQIYKAPQILIFTLKRFKASNRMFKQKLETYVDFPINGLDMTDYLINTKTPQDYEQETEDDNGEAKKNKAIYDLYAVSNHFGGLGGGHYTAYAKNHFTKQWYNFDDSHVGQVAEHSVVTKSAYVLCYQLRTDLNDTQQFQNNKDTKIVEE